jgi:hypothetical protein
LSLIDGNRHLEMLLTAQSSTKVLIKIWAEMMMKTELTAFVPYANCQA